MGSQTPTASTADFNDSPPRPVIFLICVHQPEMFDELCKRLIDRLATKAILKRASRTRAAANFLKHNTPSAVIVTNVNNAEGNPVLNDLNKALVKYATDGGTIILWTFFSRLVSPPDFDRWLKKTWKLPWTFGDYCRADVARNPRCDLNGYASEALIDSYSQQAVFLANVDKEAAVYLRSQNFDDNQTLVAFAKYGAGRLGYIGDVNNEEGSTIAIINMYKL